MSCRFAVTIITIVAFFGCIVLLAITLGTHTVEPHVATFVESHLEVDPLFINNNNKGFCYLFIC